MWLSIKYFPPPSDVLKQFDQVESQRENPTVIALRETVGDTHLSVQQRAIQSIAMTLTVRPSSLFFNECAMGSRIPVCSGCQCIPLCIFFVQHIEPAWYLLSLPGVQSNSPRHKRAGGYKLNSMKTCFLKPLSVENALTPSEQHKTAPSYRKTSVKIHKKEHLVLYS